MEKMLLIKNRASSNFAGAFLIGIFLLIGPNVWAAVNACPSGSYAIVKSPDGSALSILFDEFALQTDGKKTCHLQIPLNLPPNYGVGVYRIDYRGFAVLAKKQQADLNVLYRLGDHNKKRNFHRKVKGDFDGDFVFTENIGAGLMKRMGCGEDAVMDISVDLELQTSGVADEAMASLDTADGAGGLIYYFDLKKCKK
jgi:hypothetical protein